MSFRAELCVEKAQFRQLPFRDLRRVGLHLVDVPINTQESTFEEISLGCIQPERHSACKGLLVLGETGEGINDHASIGGFNDAGMDGKGADVGLFCAEPLCLLKITGQKRYP